MATTLKQIAEATGLSMPTISHVLNPQSKRGHLYRQETRELVQKVADELGYRPNMAAQSTRQGRFGSVSLVLSTDSVRSMVGEGLIGGILAGLESKDMHLNITALPDAALTHSGYVPKILRTLMVDGLLLNYNAAIPQRMVELIKTSHLPKIWVNSKHAVDCVYPDELGAARKITERLLALGHRRIGFAGYGRGTSEPSWHYSSVDRYAGYAQAMEQAGLSPRLLSKEKAIPIEGQQRIAFSKQWLSEPDRPTAVICYNPEATNAVMMAAQGMGLSLPRQLTVVTYGGNRQGQLGIMIGTMILPECEMGRVGAEMLLERIENPECVSPARELGIGFEPGETFGPPEGA